MQAVFNHLDFFLNFQESFSLKQAARTAVTVKRGSVWVTQDGHLEDHVLEAGQSLFIRDNEGVVFSALRPAEVTIDCARQRGASERLLRKLQAAYLRAFRYLGASQHLALARTRIGRGSSHYSRHLLSFVGSVES